MAHTLSAKKRIRQNVKQRARNRWRKNQIKEAIRQLEEHVHSGEKSKAQEQLSVCFKALDKVASKGTIHKNTADRKKARLARRVEKMEG